MRNKDRKNQHKCKYPHQIKHYNPNKHSWDKKKPMKRGNIADLQWVNSTTKTWERPIMPYKFHIQYDKTRNFIKDPSNHLNWARIVHMKTYTAYTNELMEDLNVNPDVSMDIVTKHIPDCVTYIKTVFDVEECVTIQVPMEEDN